MIFSTTSCRSCIHRGIGVGTRSSSSGTFPAFRRRLNWVCLRGSCRPAANSRSCTSWSHRGSAALLQRTRAPAGRRWAGWDGRMAPSGSTPARPVRARATARRSPAPSGSRACPRRSGTSKSAATRSATSGSRTGRAVPSRTRTSSTTRRSSSPSVRPSASWSRSTRSSRPTAVGPTRSRPGRWRMRHPRGLRRCSRSGRARSIPRPRTATSRACRLST